MNLLNVSNVVKSVGDSLDDLFTSDEERMEAEREMYRAKKEFVVAEKQLTTKVNMAQAEINLAEAQSSHFFVAGWRPAIGWIGAAALAYQFLIYPALTWFSNTPPPQMEPDMLYTIITGMLGIAGMRSFDKVKDKDTKHVKRK